MSEGYVAEDLDKLQQDFAKSIADTSGSFLTNSASLATVDSKRLETQLGDPIGNREELNSLMTALYRKNGIVKGTVKYLHSILTYNHSIYPVMTSKSGFEIKGEDREEYGSVANELSLYNVKYYAPYFLKQTLLNGMALFYEIKDGKGVSYVEFPSSWGRVYAIDNNVFRWELNMSKVPEDILTLPNEIQNALKEYAAGQTDDLKKWSDGEWFRLSEKGFAFSLDQDIMNSGIGLSELSEVMLDTLKLEKAKEKVEDLDRIENIRILHSEIPTDRDGKPMMSAKTAQIYDRQLKNSLPKGIAGITSPMKVTNVPLSGSGNNATSYDMVTKAQKQVFLSTGTPEGLFGGETTSSNIVKLAIQKDANWLYTKAIPMLENYYNSRLQKVKVKSNMTWKIKFVRQSYFTLKEDVAIVEKQLTMGGSRLDYLAACGLEPTEVFGKLMMEQIMLNIDTFMLPKQSSHTLGANGNSGDIGRPTTDDPTDDTTRISDSQ